MVCIAHDSIVLCYLACSRAVALTNHIPSYYCRASLVAIEVEGGIRAVQDAKEKAEEELKKLLTNPERLNARALKVASRPLQARLEKLRDDLEMKIQLADDKAYTHFDRSASSIHRKDKGKCPLYSDIHQLHCMNQVQRIVAVRNSILEHYQDRVNKKVLDDLGTKLIDKQHESWDKLIRDAKLDLAKHPFPFPWRRGGRPANVNGPPAAAQARAPPPPPPPPVAAAQAIAPLPAAAAQAIEPNGEQALAHVMQRFNAAAAQQAARRPNDPRQELSDTVMRWRQGGVPGNAHNNNAVGGGGWRVQAQAAMAQQGEGARGVGGEGHGAAVAARAPAPQVAPSGVGAQPRQLQLYGGAQAQRQRQQHPLRLRPHSQQNNNAFAHRELGMQGRSMPANQAIIHHQPAAAPPGPPLYIQPDALVLNGAANPGAYMEFMGADAHAPIDVDMMDVDMPGAFPLNGNGANAATPINIWE